MREAQGMRHCGGTDVDGSLWTEVVDRRRKLWTEVVGGSCGQKLWRKLWTDPFGLINRSFSIELDLMELKMKNKYAKEYSNLKKKKNGHHSTKVTK